MSPNICDETSIDLVFFRKSDDTIVWINFRLQTSKKQLLLEKLLCLYVIFLWAEQKFILQKIFQWLPSNVCKKEQLLDSAQKLYTYHRTTLWTKIK